MKGFLILFGGLAVKIWVFGLLILYFIPFFFFICTVVSFRDSFVQLVDKNNAVAWKDFKEGVGFSVLTYITFIGMYNREEIWKWANQFI